MDKELEDKLKGIPGRIRDMILGHWEVCRIYAEAVDAGVASSAIDEMKASLPVTVSEEAWSLIYDVGSGKLDMRTFMESPQYLELFTENVRPIIEAMQRDKKTMDRFIGEKNQS